jgi:TRAP-type C4-dicarboxylate transport system permease small subunit
MQLDPATPKTAASARVHAAFAFMNNVYLWAGYAAGMCLVSIFVVTMIQVGGRLAGWNPPGLTDYAGYLTAAATFLALGYSLNRGAQVRVSLFLSMSGAARPWLEMVALVISGVVAIWFAFHSWNMVLWSYKLGDMSSGLDATHLWIPQLSMAIGASLLAVAVVDHTLRLWLLGDHGIADADEPL